MFMRISSTVTIAIRPVIGLAFNGEVLVLLMYLVELTGAISRELNPQEAHMPSFDLIPLQEAMLQSTLTGRRGAIMQEYLAYVERLEPGKAGRLTIGEGETSAAIKRRLGAVAKLTGKELVVKRVHDDIYFWPAETRRRRGRPRKRPLTGAS